MLQAEDSLTAAPVASRDLAERDTGRGLVHDEGEANRPLSRDIPRETGERTASPAQAGDAATGKGDTPRKGVFRRPLVLSFGALLLASVAGGGYLYWDNASHFETTDDAFIAARQFAVAPKVSGYITAVPVTDNQHVATGQVIARIDDRDYRTALAQAQAQVDAAQASIANIEAQTAVQQAQVAQNLSQVQQQQASLTFAQQQASRYTKLAKDGWGTVQDAQQWPLAAAPGRGWAEIGASALVGARRGSWRAQGSAQQRRGEPRAGDGSARAGEAQPLVYDRHRRAARARRAAFRRRRAVRPARHRAVDVRA